VTGEAGGPVRLRAASGQRSYTGLVRNGVTSENWETFDGSFLFTSPVVVVATQQANPQGGVCPADAKGYRGASRTVQCACRADQMWGTIWGSGLYTDDSSICLAAVHAGIITRSGGMVSFVPAPGQNSYTGTVQNGITTKAYGGWSGSFRFAN